MTNQPAIKLSVIIPVYNAEQTLRETLDSLLNQSLPEIEVICVDDGSADASPAILAEYAQKDARVRVLTQQNRYAGVARNAGIDAARGGYLFFLDADDTVLNYALEAAYNKCLKYELDCLRFPGLTWDEQQRSYVSNIRNEFTSLHPGDYNRLLTLQEESPLLKVSVTPWGGMYRRDFLTDNGIRFNGLRCVNDRTFFNKLITTPGRFMCSLDRVTVHRVNQKDSLIGRKADHFDCQIASIRMTEKQLLEDGIGPESTELVMRQEYLDLLVWYKRYSGQADRRAVMDRAIEAYLKDPESRYNVLLQNLMEEADESEPPQPPVRRTPVHEATEHPLVSVVVPIMNVEDYLNLALDSLTNQTMEEMEFILLNDGSTDRSMTIMKEYAEIDKRFVIVDKPNSGYGHTMNTGIDRARGDYIGILEPDDFAERNMFERLYQEASRFDLDFVKSDFNHFEINPDGSLKKKPMYLSLDGTYYNRTLCPGREKETFFFPINTWSGIYRREFLNKHHIRHHETPGASFQDNGFWFQTFCLGERVRFIRDQLYLYRRDNPNSSMLSSKKEMCVTEEYRWIHQWLESDSRLLKKYESVMYNKQLLSMTLTLSRLEASRKLPYLKHMKEELTRPYEQGLFDRNYLHALDWDRLDRIMADPQAYYDKIDVSVIVPVYNAEEYLERCLRSVLFRSNVNIEVICVDDGSTDSSPEILRRMAEADCRIRVFTLENRGAGAARNEGMAHARGEYLAFLDADDFFEQDMLDRAWNRSKIEDLDIIVFRSDNFFTDTQTYGSPQGCREELLPGTGVFAGTDVARDMFRLFMGWAWDKLFRTAFVREKGLRFAELRSSNDLGFVFTAIACAPRIFYLKTPPLAHHRRYSGSVSTSREQSWDNFYRALVLLRESLREQGLYERFERDFINYCLHFSLWHMATVTGEAYEKIYRKLTGEWFEELGLYDHPRAYFYHGDQYGMMTLMRRLEPEDFLLRMFNRLRNRPAVQPEEGQAGVNEAILNSVSYRLGRAMTALPRKGRTVVRMMREQGFAAVVRYGKQMGQAAGNRRK